MGVRKADNRAVNSCIPRAYIPLAMTTTDKLWQGILCRFSHNKKNYFQDDGGCQNVSSWRYWPASWEPRPPGEGGRAGSLRSTRPTIIYSSRREVFFRVGLWLWHGELVRTMTGNSQVNISCLYSFAHNNSGVSPRSYLRVQTLCGKDN